MSRLFLVDDHSWFRRALASLLEHQQDLEVAAEAGSLAEARRVFPEEIERVDVVILDLFLPDGAGTELIGGLREARPGIPVLLLTAAQDPEVIRWAQAMGADEVVSKAASLEEILTILRRLAQRRAWGRG